MDYDGKVKAARREAIAVISTMMGAMILARTAGAGEFSDEILNAGRHAALRGEEVTSPEGGLLSRIRSAFK